MKAIKEKKQYLKFYLLVFLISFISACFLVPSSFSQSQRALASLYSNYLKGIFYLEKGDDVAGLKELKKAKAKDPKSIQIRLKIASVLVRLDRLSEAEIELKQAKKINPDNLDLSLALIFVYSYSDREEELEEEYEKFLNKAHKLKPKDIGISEYLAQFYFYRKKPQAAIKLYEKLLANNPEYIDAFFWLGYLYEEVGRHKEAIVIWKKGLKVDSLHAPILNSLGYIYAESGINLDEAETMIKKALDKEPENGAYLDSLGWLYFKKKNYSDAENYLLEAISRIKDPDIYEHLGDLYIAIGKQGKASEYYREGFLRFPNDESLKDKNKKYEKDKISKE